MDLRDKKERLLVELRRQGIFDAEVLKAIRKVPRERFVLEEWIPYAYDNRPLPIGEEQTISQPYIVAFMAEAAHLNKDAKVLEVGAGCGYGASILGQLAKEVYSIECIPSLAKRAKETIEELGYINVHILEGDGSLGYEEKAPYDAIVVTASAQEVPESLKAQLKVGGRLVIPAGEKASQHLYVFEKLSDDDYEIHKTLSVRFVPLVGRDV